MQSSPRIEGVAETILYVDDVPRAVAFYRDVLGLTVLGGDGVRFQALNPGGRQALLLFKRGGTLVPLTLPGGVIPPHDGSGSSHLGLAISHEAYEPWKAKLAAAAVPIESEAKWERGGRSIYFRDPDGHLLELVTPGIWPNY